ncbi:MAG: hypothetical protein ACJKSS_02620 [Patescibacteria group bacterium UBA2103]
MNTRAAIVIVVIAVIVLAAYLFWPTGKNMEENQLVKVDGTEVIEEEFALEHTFEDGVHTISGIVQLPTPCHELREDVVVAESFPEQVSITLTTVDTGGICIQVIDPREFSIDVEVDEKATFSLSINDTKVLVPALAVE